MLSSLLVSESLGEKSLVFMLRTVLMRKSLLRFSYSKCVSDVLYCLTCGVNAHRSVFIT